MTEDLLTKIRQCRGLDANDTSQDADIQQMSPLAQLRDISRWTFGDANWADEFLEWAKECGYEITDPHSQDRVQIRPSPEEAKWAQSTPVSLPTITTLPFIHGDGLHTRLICRKCNRSYVLTAPKKLNTDELFDALTALGWHTDPDSSLLACHECVEPKQ